MSNVKTQMSKRIHIVVIGAIRYKNKYLLTKRVHTDETWHAKWQLPGGELEQGETFIEAVKRELYEELGLKMNKFTFVKSIFEAINYGKRKFHIVLVPFFIPLDTDKFTIKLDKEASEYGWFSAKEVSKLIALKNTYEIVKAAEKIV